MLSKAITYACFILCACIIQHTCPAQNSSKSIDTLRISYDELESIFLKNNFQLLSQKFNIQISEATIKQARLYVNPNFFYENVLYNPNNGHWFDNTAQNGERQVQLQQLILLGGKRSRLVKMAEINKSIEEFAFYDLLRSLQFQLISDYALVYFDMEKQKLLINEGEKLSALVDNFKMQVGLGSVSAYELTRVEYEYNILKNDINELSGEIAQAQSRLRLMTQLTNFIQPTSLDFLNNKNFVLTTLIDSAYNYRPDLKMSENQVHLMQRTLGYQKALAIPDLTLGGDYDRFGNAFPNYVGVNIGMSLPVFNRNQGNIKKAQLGVENSQLLFSYNRASISQEVQEAYTKFENTRKLYGSISLDYKNRINSISDEAINRYNQRVISLLDFVDKIKTYKNGRLSIIEVEYNYFISRQYLNFVTNTKLF